MRVSGCHKKTRGQRKRKGDTETGRGGDEKSVSVRVSIEKKE